MKIHASITSERVCDAVERQTFTDDTTGEDRDYFIANCRVNGTEERYYLSGTAVMPKVAVIEQNQDELPATFKLIKRRTRHGQMYDLIEPDAGEAFDSEVGDGQV